MFFSKTTNGFYDPKIHGENIPEDAVAITHERHAELMAGQAAGKIISGGNDGYPILTDPPAPTAEQVILSQIAAIEATITQRRIREAALTEAGKAWLAEQDAAIAALRAKYL